MNPFADTISGDLSFKHFRAVQIFPCKYPVWWEVKKILSVIEKQEIVARDYVIYMKFSKEARTGICMQDEEVDVGELVQGPVYCPDFSPELRGFSKKKQNIFVYSFISLSLGNWTEISMKIHFFLFNFSIHNQNLTQYNTWN